VRAVVLSAERTHDHRWRIHVQFIEVTEPERRRLVSAVADVERKARRVAGGP
jgi:hypothetical protein